MKFQYPKCGLVILLALISAPVFGETYSWEDGNGMHFTDDPSKIPSKFRKKALGKNEGKVGSSEDASYERDLSYCEDDYNWCVRFSNGSNGMCDLSLRKCKMEASDNKEKSYKLSHRNELIAEKAKLRGLSRQEIQRLIRGEIWIGLPSYLVELAKGAPQQVNTIQTAFGSQQQWVYYGDYLYFRDGVLTTIQDR